MQITEELIWLCLDELTTQATKKQKYKDYYDGSHAILQDYDMQDSRSNRKLIFNFPRKFVDNETGYLLGRPVNFISKSDNQGAIDCIDTNLSYWDKGHNMNLRKQSEIYGESYELQYINGDGELCATVLTPLNCYCLVDGTAERNVLLAIQNIRRLLRMMWIS